eukprot:366523-Chlamydomonas_euryale.AAC.5
MQPKDNTNVLRCARERAKAWLTPAVLPNAPVVMATLVTWRELRRWRRRSDFPAPGGASGGQGSAFAGRIGTETRTRVAPVPSTPRPRSTGFTRTSPAGLVLGHTPSARPALPRPRREACRRVGRERPSPASEPRNLPVCCHGGDSAAAAPCGTWASTLPLVSSTPFGSSSCLTSVRPGARRRLRRPPRRSPPAQRRQRAPAAEGHYLACPVRRPLTASAAGAPSEPAPRKTQQTATAAGLDPVPPAL